MGGAPRSPAPRNHLLVWIVKASGCHCTDESGVNKYRRVPTPLRNTSLFSQVWKLGVALLVKNYLSNTGLIRSMRFSSCQGSP